MRLARRARKSTLLPFVTGLRIEGNGDNVSLSGDLERHPPCLLADRLAPIDFSGVVVSGDPRHEVFETVAAADVPDWCDSDEAIPHHNVHLVPNTKVGILQHIPGKA